MKLTKAQRQIYSMTSLAGGSVANVCGSMLLNGQKDIDFLKEKVNMLFALNDGLRIQLYETDCDICQRILAYNKRDIPVKYFSDYDEFYGFACDYAKTPLPNDCLCEILLAILPDKYGIIPKINHLIGDAWAIALIGSQFNQLVSGQIPSAFSFSEQISKEKTYLESNRFKRDAEFFEDKFKSFNNPIYISDVVSKSFEAKRKTIVLNKEITSEIRAFALENETTVFSLLFSVFSVCFSNINLNADEFCIGTTVLNRSGEKEKNTIGSFVNTVPIFVKLNPDTDILVNLKNIETELLATLRHQKYNYQVALETFRSKDLIIQKPFDIIFNYQNSSIMGDFSESLWLHNGMQIESLQIHIEDRDNEGTFKIHYDYQTEKFAEKDIVDFHNHFNCLLTNILDNPEKKISDLEMLSADEKKRLLYDFNDTFVDYPKEKGVYELFENHVIDTPDKQAVIFKDVKLTYCQLSEKVSECADRLVGLGIKKGDIVAVHLERSHELIVFQLAVLKIGAIFLPVDKRYPIERIRQMCINCEVDIFITDENDKVSLDVNVILFKDFELITTIKKAETVTNLEDSYIIYTSGSTGVPKGCILTGKGLLNFCLNNNTLETLNCIEHPVFACVNSSSFDYFIAETLLPLTNGFTTVVLDETESIMQEQFLSVVAENNINVVMTTPTRLKIYFNNKYDCSALKKLLCICTSGEPLTPDLLEQMYTKSPEAEVYNPIGPSECSVWDMGGKLNKADGLDIHIGKPIANVQIYITDKFLRLVPIGVTGEICIAGDGVGRGYLNNLELTSEKFVDNPFGEGKLYRTGDLAYWRDDGNIVYVGRNDFQVKIRGLRIELGEIECAIEAIKGVEHVAVIARKNNQDDEFICAYYTGEEKKIKELREETGKSLPKYMIPHVFVHLEEMPMTASGKVNRKTLPEIDFENIGTEEEFICPETDEEKALADAICSVLKVKNVNMVENFFNLGGDSIKAIYVVSEVEDKGYELHVSDIMKSESLSDIAVKMKAVSDKAIYEQGEVNGLVPFSPIMRAYLKERNTISEEYVHTCIVSSDCDEYIARKAIDAIVAHHDMLRGVFCDDGIRIYPMNEREAYSFKTITIDDPDKAKEHLNSIEISEDKTVNIVFCKTEKENLISIKVHHFLIDLISWEVLINDFQRVLTQIKNGEEIALPAKTASFKMWVDELQKYAECMSEENKEYWKKLNQKLDKVKTLSCNTDHEAERYSFTLYKEVSEKLINEANNAYGTRPNEIVLTALGLAAAKIAGGAVGIVVESHGRTEIHRTIAVERTVGWFTSCYPVVINNKENISDEIIGVKETLRRMPGNGIDYLLLSQGFHENTDIVFNFYQNKINPEKGLSLVAFNSDTSVFPGKIIVDCVIKDNILEVKIFVPKCKYRKLISEELGIEFERQLESIAEVCTSTDKVTKTCSDFSDYELEESELNEIKELYDCNGEIIDDIYGLTPSQEGICAQSFGDSDTKAYHLQGLLRISKATDLNIIKKSIEMLSLRHRVLKTSFAVLKSTGMLKQIVSENRTPEYRTVLMDEPFSQECLNKLAEEETEKTLDLTKDSLFRVTVVDFTDERYMLMYAHHIILDGWCLPVITDDLQKYYSELAKGVSAEHLSEEINREVSSETSYAQYVNWIRSRDKSVASGYWKDLLSDYTDAHIFGKEKRSNIRNKYIVTFKTPLRDELCRQIDTFAKESKVSLNTIYECAFAIALQKYSGSEDVIYDKVISGRNIPLKNIENTVGAFINTVPARMKSDENSGLADLFKIVQGQTADSEKYGILPLAEVYRHCDIDSRSVDALFVFENYYTGEISDIEKGSLSPELIFFKEQTEFNLSVTILKEKDGYMIRTSYAEEIYTEREVSDFIRGYISILEASLDINKKIKDISLADIEQLNRFNATSHTYNIPENSTVYSLFEKTAKEKHGKVCIRTAEKEITFGELLKNSEKLDAEIRRITGNKKSVIAVIAERSVEMYSAIYGIIRGGNAYLPIDPEYPQERIEYILKNSGAAAAAVQGKFTDKVKNIPCIDMTELINGEYDSDNILPCAAEEEDTAYVIYTSGSTGNPKGAKVSHRSVVNRILWMHDKYPLDAEDVILQKTPYTFDVSVWEHFWWGMCGGSLAVSKPGEHFLPAKILDEVKRNSVTHLHFVPSVFELFLNYLETHKEETEKFDSVKYVFLSGEALTANLVERFYRLYDYEKVSLHNLYGPTECAVDVTYYDCKPTDTDPVPIGKPIYNTQMYVVDKYNNAVPVGVTGELCIAGMNVGQGYLNNPELTAEKFIDNPFGEGKLYRTGDLAYWREDGNIIFCGRKDFQIKLNGQRVEIGEIESVISDIMEVENTAVMVRHFNHRDVLVAFYCGKEGKETEIKDFCRERLPKYMVPSFIVHLDAMPLNQNGKLDRKILAETELNLQETEIQAPLNDTERYICEAFEKILGEKNTGRNSDFFEIGGTSLSMISLLSEKGFENITSADFIRNPTPELLALQLNKKSFKKAEYIEAMYIPEKPKQVLILLPYAGGGAEAYSNFVSALKKTRNDTAVYFIRYLHSLTECKSAADEITELFKDIGILFYSHCVGSAVALQIIRFLESKNVSVKQYFAGAIIPPVKTTKNNIWNIIPDRILKAILIKAGADLKGVSHNKISDMLKKFRLDTDFATVSFREFSGKIKTPVCVVISKNDIFTKKYENTEPAWSKYVCGLVNVKFIDSNSHYFQSDNSDELLKLIFLE